MTSPKGTNELFLKRKFEDITEIGWNSQRWLQKCKEITKPSYSKLPY